MDPQLQQNMQMQSMLAHQRSQGGEGGGGGDDSLDQLLIGGTGILEFLFGSLMSNGGAFSVVTEGMERSFGRLAPKSPAVGTSFAGMKPGNGLGFSWQSMHSGKGFYR